MLRKLLKQETKKMKKKVKKLIRETLKLSYKEGDSSHLASALSCVPILSKIYDKMKKDDVFILSKGHGSMALYVVLRAKGYKPDTSKLHPDIDVKNGISATTGSLGHGLPLAVGMAWAKKIKKEKGTIRVLMGDGECAEGTTWESLLIIDTFKINNIEIYIDDNGYQALDKTVHPAISWIKKLGIKKIFISKYCKGYGLGIFNPYYAKYHVHPLTEEEYKKSMKELK